MTDKPLREALCEALCEYRMTNMGDDDGQPYPLIDLCSNDGTSIDTGRAELAILADYLISDPAVVLALTQARRSIPSEEGIE